MKIIQHRGNIEILKNYKVAFLSSRKISPLSVIKIYDWALEMRNSGQCVMSGFQSHVEKEVFDILINGTQPVILVEGRSIKKNYPASIEKALSENRLLILSPFDSNNNKKSLKNSELRNRFMFENAEKIFIGYASIDGMIDRLCHEYALNGKIEFIDEGLKNRYLFADA